MNVRKICKMLCNQAKEKDECAQNTLAEIIADVFINKSGNDNNAEVNSNGD